MKLKYKLILIFSFIILIYSYLNYWLITYVILPHNNLLCHSIAMNDFERWGNAKNEYLNHLKTLVKSYAAWDDTYLFMQHENTKKYIKDNLGLSTFSNLGINMLLCYDAKGNLYWGNDSMDVKADDYNEATLSKIIKEKYSRLLSTEKPRTGIIVSQNNLFLVASHPIVKSSPISKEPPIGVVIMGILQDEKFQKKLSKNTSINFRMIPMNEQNRKKYAKQLKELDKLGEFYFDSINEDTDTVYTYLLDINGNPSILFISTFDKQIYTSNYAMLKFFLKIFILIGIVSLLLLIWGLQKTIITPVLKLTDNIVKIKTTKKYSVDMGTKRRDEIGILTNRFNEMQRIFKEYDENLEKMVEIKANDALKSKKDTIVRLAIASEKKDVDTGKHIERISKYSQFLAEKYGLLKSDCEMISWASILHDIGKIGTPDNILKKPGKLTEEEYNIMKKHTEIGWKILEGSESELLGIARDVALSHHELWNGKGYPKGLKGEAIPLSARIVAIVDVFDALLSKRAYKEPFQDEEVIQFFKDNKGKRFDPLLTDAFLENIDDFFKIGKDLREVKTSGVNANAI